MRIDARDPGFCPPWLVWHAEHCCVVPGVVWVTDEPPEYGIYAVPERLGPDGKVLCRAIAVNKVVILPANKSVVINPVPHAVESTEACKEATES